MWHIEPVYTMWKIYIYIYSTQHVDWPNCSNGPQTYPYRVYNSALWSSTSEDNPLFYSPTASSDRHRFKARISDSLNTGLFNISSYSIVFIWLRPFLCEEYAILQQIRHTTDCAGEPKDCKYYFPCLVLKGGINQHYVQSLFIIWRIYEEPLWRCHSGLVFLQWSVCAECSSMVIMRWMKDSPIVVYWYIE